MLLKGSTVRGQRVIAMYNSNIGIRLRDVYDNYSAAKERAWEDCWKWCEEDDGTCFHICSRNSHQFTVGWTYDDPETGHRIIRVETAANTYRVDTEV